MSQGKSYKELVDEQCSHSRPFTEPQILCPNCGCLSPVGTRKCDCGYKLRPSSTPYVITALVVVLLLAFSIGLIASGWSPRSDVTLAVPTPTAAPPSEPEPEPTLAPEPVYDFEPLSESATKYIYYQGDVYHHSRECPAFDVNMHFSYDRVHTLSCDHLKQSPCSVCVKKSRFKLTEITNLFYQNGMFHASRACDVFSSLTPFTAAPVYNGLLDVCMRVNYDYFPCPECIDFDEIDVQNGDVINDTEENCLSTLTISAPQDKSCYVYLFSLNETDAWSALTRDECISFYVEKGQTVTVKVPLGKYEIYYACGDSWYGYVFLFGFSTTYHKVNNTYFFYNEGYSSLNISTEESRENSTTIIPYNEFP